MHHKKTNRMILRELKEITYFFIWQTHALERRGKTRNEFLKKKLGDSQSILLMLDHINAYTKSCLFSIKDSTAKRKICAYYKKFHYYSSCIKNNCSVQKPLKKRIVSKMLTSHTNLFNYLYKNDAIVDKISKPNIDELAKIIQTGVNTWKDDFRGNIDKFLKLIR